MCSSGWVTASLGRPGRNRAAVKGCLGPSLLLLPSGAVCLHSQGDLWQCFPLSGWAQVAKGLIQEHNPSELKAENCNGTYLSLENIPVGGEGHSKAEGCSACLMQTSIWFFRAPLCFPTAEMCHWARDSWSGTVKSKIVLFFPVWSRVLPMVAHKISCVSRSPKLARTWLSGTRRGDGDCKIHLWPSR